MSEKFIFFQSKEIKIIPLILFSIMLIFLLSGCDIQVPDINHWFVEPTSSPSTTNLPTSTLTPTITSSHTAIASETASPTFTETITTTPKPSNTNTLDVTLTPSLSPTITQTPTRTLIPTRTRYPTFTPRPSRTPTITLTPAPPLAYFRITNLGPFSFVTSPFKPEAIVSPGEDGLIIVELIGEDGRTITKENINYSNFMGRRFGIAPSIDFDIDFVSEYGRLNISSKDRYERMLALTSVDLILLKLGSNKISSPKVLTEPYLIREPDAEDVIQGGMIIVEGLARILSANPIIIECVDPEGNIICSAEVEVDAPNQILSHIPFEAYIPYSVQESTNVRFSIRQESTSRLPGIIHLYSFEITLEP